MAKRKKTRVLEGAMVRTRAKRRRRSRTRSWPSPCKTLSRSSSTPSETIPTFGWHSLIAHVSFVTAALSEMNYDANKMPLGKLAKSTLTQGFAALKVRHLVYPFTPVVNVSAVQELAEVINDPNGATAQQYGGRAKAYEQLSGRYYSWVIFATPAGSVDVGSGSSPMTLGGRNRSASTARKS
jgi:hypothetical protein